MRLPTLAVFLLTCAALAADFRGLLEAYCLDCHDSEAKKGDLDLSSFMNETAVMKNRGIWRSVFEKIESHQMPPPKQKSQPTEAQRRDLMAWIIDIAARPDPELGVADPRNPTLRRLTRLEYNNTIRDLFGLPMDVFRFPERLPLSSKAYSLLLFETVLVEVRSILDLLAGDYTWLNGRLAKLYDIDVASLSGKTGNSNLLIDAKQSAKWLRVPLKDKRRGGCMTMAGPLTVTSLPMRTSPVKRGAWLLETLFNRPPQEPKVAFALKDEPQSQTAPQTVRQRFERHRDKPACFSCHVRLDPPGFDLERFDAIGAWRNMDGSQLVDARAKWHGTAFDGPTEYKAILAKHPYEFTRGFIEHLLSYALGRKLEVYDMPVIAYIDAAAQADGWKFNRRMR